MGVRYHSINQTNFFKITQVHSDRHWLLHKMGRGYPFDSCKRKSGDPIHRATSNHKVCVHSILVFDNATYLSSTRLTEFSLDKGIIIRYSANYYPWGNGVAETTNKNLVRILKNKVADNQRNWHNLLHNDLWDDRVTSKEAIGNYPYFLVYI